MTWDNDSGLNKVDENITLFDDDDTPAHMFLRLTTNAEFRQLLGDRVQKFLFNGGALTPAACAARCNTQLTNIVDQPVIAESARWGDYSRDVYHWIAGVKGWPAYLHTCDLSASATDPPGNPAGPVDDSQQKNWVQVRDEKLANYCPNRGTNLISQYKANGWYSDTLQVPVLGQNGGAVSAGFGLSITNPNSGGTGDIAYTTDGTDPRAVGGGTSGTATVAGDSTVVTINQVTTVRARIRNGSTWSNLVEFTFYPPQSFQNLVVNELHYHPAVTGTADADDFEFIELFNKGATPLRLDDVSFSRGVSFHFPKNTTLAAGQYLVLVRPRVVPEPLRLRRVRRLPGQPLEQWRGDRAPGRGRQRDRLRRLPRRRAVADDARRHRSVAVVDRSRVGQLARGVVDRVGRDQRHAGRREQRWPVEPAAVGVDHCAVGWFVGDGGCGGVDHCERVGQWFGRAGGVPRGRRTRSSGARTRLRRIRAHGRPRHRVRSR